MHLRGRAPVRVAIWAAPIAGSRRVGSAAIAPRQFAGHACLSMRARLMRMVTMAIPSAKHFWQRVTAVLVVGAIRLLRARPAGRRFARAMCVMIVWRLASLRRRPHPKARANGSGNRGGTWRPVATTTGRVTMFPQARRRSNGTFAGMTLLGSRRGIGSIRKLGKGRALVTRVLGPCREFRWLDRVRIPAPGTTRRGSKRRRITDSR